MYESAAKDFRRTFWLTRRWCNTAAKTAAKTAARCMQGKNLGYTCIIGLYAYDLVCPSTLVAYCGPQTLLLYGSSMPHLALQYQESVTWYCSNNNLILDTFLI